MADGGNAHPGGRVVSEVKFFVLSPLRLTSTACGGPVRCPIPPGLLPLGHPGGAES